jgi:hypothetical protein
MADELVVGTVVSVADQPGARAPSLLLTVELGSYGTVEAVVPLGRRERSELEGRQIVVRREDDGAVVVGAHSHAKGLVLLRADEEVEPGTLVT